MLKHEVIYLDNAATTKPDPEVLKEMLPYNEYIIGNASSVHSAGVEASKGVERAREIIAQNTGAKPCEIFFTSGGTESNNLAIKGVAFKELRKNSFKKHIIASAIEHPSVLNILQWLENFGYEVTYLPVDTQGFVHPGDVEKAIKKATLLVTVMHANNEIGVIEPVKEIGKICAGKEVYFHTDACQSFTRTELNVKTQHIDFLTLNAHKIHGPKGVGAIYLKEGITIDPLLHGGGQENNLRSGTHNTPGIAGLGRAAQIASQSDTDNIKALRDYFLQRIFNTVDDVLLNGPAPAGGKRLCNNINISIRNVQSGVLFSELNRKNIIISTGSACHSAERKPSYVLTAMGLSSEAADEAIRISLSKWNTKDEVDYVIENIKEIVKIERENKLGLRHRNRKSGKKDFNA